jgi:SAM-dependent methyltransferase
VPAKGLSRPQPASIRTAHRGPPTVIVPARWACPSGSVVATDVTPQLLAIGQRAAAERGLALCWQPADAQQLPFPDGAFDVVLSTVGAMFAPDQRAAASELLRVCRPGGTVAMGNWTPGGAAGRFFDVLSRYRPAPDVDPEVDTAATDPGPPPTAWGDPAHVAELFGAADPHAEIHTELRTLELAFTGPPAELCAYYREHFAPVILTRAALDDERAQQLDRDLLELFRAEDTGPPGGPSRYRYEYLLVLVRPPLTPRRTPTGAAAATG